MKQRYTLAQIRSFYESFGKTIDFPIGEICDVLSSNEISPLKKIKTELFDQLNELFPEEFELNDNQYEILIDSSFQKIPEIFLGKTFEEILQIHEK